MIYNLRGKSYLLTLLIVLTIFCGITGVVKGDEVAEWNLYSDDYFSISYPDDWFVVENELENMPSIDEMIIFSDMSGSVAINVVIEDLSAYNLSLEQYIELSEMNLELAAESITPINTYSKGNAIKLNVNGTEAYKIIYILDLGNVEGIDIEVKTMQIMFIKDKKSYVITYQAISEQFDKFSAYADKAIESFKFAD